MTTQKLESLLEWLFSLSGPSLKWDIETALAFDEALGNPSRAYPCAHIAGTNGKGSVAAMLQSMSIEAGHLTGLFTSPHLIRPEERVRIGRQDISKSRFRERVLELRDVAAQGLDAGLLERHPSFFEMVAALALVHFREAQVDLAVIETGLGGRLDATNVIQAKLCVITTIASDHIKSLGGSLLSIAREKAGIIKPGVPVIAGWIAPEPLALIRDIALERGAPFHSAEAEITVGSPTSDGCFTVETPQRKYRRLQPALAGAHQRTNAALALRAAELLTDQGLRIDPESAVRGVSSCEWAGRLETIDADGRFLLDAAHNEEGILALTRHLRARDEERGRPDPRILILGLSEGRKIEDIYGHLGGLVDHVLLTQARTRKAIEVATMVSGLPPELTQVDCPGSIEETIERARQLAGATGEVLVTGSLYLVGDVRQRLLKLEGTWHRAAERLPDLPPSDLLSNMESTS